MGVGQVVKRNGTPAEKISDQPKFSVFLHRDSGRLSRAGKAGARKVGTAQSTILLNRKVSARATASATETYRPQG